jgi:hypothetical protein
MTFAEGMLRLVLGGRRAGPENAADDPLFETHSEPAIVEGAQSLIAAASAVAAGAGAGAEAPGVETALAGVAAGDGANDPLRQEPGFADIEAAVALVQTGLATRVVLSSFPSWPGLLWRAYQLAEENDVLILPTVVRPGGRVDIVVMRENLARE